MSKCFIIRKQVQFIKICKDSKYCDFWEKWQTSEGSRGVKSWMPCSSHTCHVLAIAALILLKTAREPLEGFLATAWHLTGLYEALAKNPGEEGQHARGAAFLGGGRLLWTCPGCNEGGSNMEYWMENDVLVMAVLDWRWTSALYYFIKLSMSLI